MNVDWEGTKWVNFISKEGKKNSRVMTIVIQVLIDFRALDRQYLDN